MAEGPSKDDLTGLELRAPTPDDALALGTAFATIDPWRTYGFTPEEIAGPLSSTDPGALRVAVFRNDTLAGAAILRRTWLRGPYLQFLGILPEHQSSGLGSALLRWFEETARNEGNRNLWVATSSFNKNARRFYERRGFIYVATLEDLITDGISEILFRKKL